MKNFFTLNLINQKIQNDIHTSQEPDDEYFEKIIPFLDKLDLEPPEFCTDFVMAFSKSYKVLNTEKHGRIDLIFN